MMMTFDDDVYQLWKKSGAWLDHSEPFVSIPDKDLEEIQQQQVKVRVCDEVSIGHHHHSLLRLPPLSLGECLSLVMATERWKQKEISCSWT